MINIGFVTYFPSKSFFLTLENLKLSCGLRVIIIDNSADDTIHQNLTNFESKYENILIVLNDKNEGLAYGLNLLIKTSHDLCLATIIYFDQDATITGDLLLKLSKYSTFSLKDKTAIVVPNNYDRNNHLNLPTTSEYIEILLSISNGMVFNVPLLCSLNRLHDVSFFIDYVDFEFSLYLNSIGLKVLCATNVITFHSPGVQLVSNIFGKSFRLLKYPAWRNKKQLLNRKVCWRRYYRHYPLWVLKDILDFVKDGIKEKILKIHH